MLLWWGRLNTCAPLTVKTRNRQNLPITQRARCPHSHVLFGLSEVSSELVLRFSPDLYRSPPWEASCEVTLAVRMGDHKAGLSLGRDSSERQ